MGTVAQARVNGRLRLGASAVAAQLAAVPARAGDDDKPPAYKIYIDPETGKYTTEDPGTAEQAQLTVRPAAAEDAGAADLPLLLTAAGVIAALAAFVLVSKHLRQAD